MEDCIDDIKNWIAFNKLKLNKDKTEPLSILPSHPPRKCSVDSITIKSSNCVRNLGNLLNTSMHMKKQVNLIVKNCKL